MIKLVEMPKNTNIATFVSIKKTCKKLRSPLTVGEKVVVLAERLRKKMHQVVFTKARPKTFLFLTEKKYL